MDERRLRLAREWLAKASHDLQNARIVGAVPGGPLDTAIYHCQQAAEKAVKGWLAYQGVAFEKTHDVAGLVAQAADIESRFLAWKGAAAILTPYASAFRYPGLAVEPMPSQGELQEALGHAQGIYDFVLGLLPPQAKGD